MITSEETLEENKKILDVLEKENNDLQKKIQDLMPKY